MSAHVLAVFRRTFYVVDILGNVVCIGGRSLGDGPLNVTCSALHYDWRAAPLSPGDPARVTDGILFIGDRLALFLEGAEVWRPAPWPAFRSRLAVHCGLQHLARMAGEQAPVEGVGRLIPQLVAGEPEPPQRSVPWVATAAMPLVVAFRGWLTTRLSAVGSAGEPIPAVASLLGLGPGLTPSGDDFLGAAAVTLHGLGRADIAQDLTAVLSGLLDRRTGTISAAHLRRALVGEAAAPTLEAVGAVLSGCPARVAAACQAAGTIGHTSGWDALCGVACAAASFADETQAYRVPDALCA